MLPRIGLTAAVDGERATTLFHHYSYAIEMAGGLPLCLPYVEREEALDAFVAEMDGIFFTGGMDLCPALYGEEKRPACGENQPERDKVELALLRRAIAAKKPILAICRGHQLVNAFFGGTLYQDLPTEYGTAIAHRQSEGILEPSHDILVTAGTPLFDLVGSERITGNSFHHQAVKNLGEGLMPMAYAADGTLEAFYATAYPYLRAYQWHPERLYDRDGINRRIFADFIAAASKEK